ncbi:electron transfer flavoprotein subunit alpha/FixB family protein [Telmatospirillum sp.]|uniref:electron transfer flavoprotein subunit alpha/FixB family protein n=1 Tax=Telmatospirillum sp. TaxID=2079197 RepID=UPI0028452AB0|nr:electron transfer flavoprotein subunit alpha/FixB family protein [Telmatospirillum sp.]MDR3436246.1 electron transfer flavoprotein subunit alpha/FixB family protein [Telmatospirillum sp.]
MTEPATSRPAGRPVEIDERIAAYKGVWVFIETERGHVHPVSWELIGEGRKLANTLGVDVWGVILGPQGEANIAAANEAFAHGADGVYLMEDPILAEYRTVPFNKGLCNLVNTYKPEILLLGATTLGRDLASAVATTLATGLTADCTALAIDLDTHSMAATRPTFGGSLLCTIHTLKARPQMATVRPRVMAMPPKLSDRTGKIVNVALGMQEQDIITKVLDYIPDRNQDQAQLAFADFIVAGGRGLGKVENFRLVTDLAAVLGAEVGGTRPLVQGGWIPQERQIGQTGKTIRPKLYIAAGISGAIQHRVGVEGADCIIAINSDPNAPIFDFAHYALVGDAMKILPALTEAFRNRLSVNRKTI